jgi:hypothetical protein
VPDLRSRVAALLIEVLEAPAPVAARVSAACTDLELFRLDAALRFVRRAKSPSEVFFFAEALVAAKRRNKCDRLVGLISDHASSDDKVELVAGWAFTDPYPFGSARGPVHHVSYQHCVADKDWLDLQGFSTTDPDPFDCSAGIGSHCPCIAWLRENRGRLNEFVERVVRHLCDMRHSLVHESWPVLMVADDVPGSDGGSVLDCYPCDPHDENMFRTYESGITLDRFKSITLATTLARLSATH